MGKEIRKREKKRKGERTLGKDEQKRFEVSWELWKENGRFIGEDVKWGKLGERFGENEER